MATLIAKGTKKGAKVIPSKKPKPQDGPIGEATKVSKGMKPAKAGEERRSCLTLRKRRSIFQKERNNSTAPFGGDGKMLANFQIGPATSKCTRRRGNEASTKCIEEAHEARREITMKCGCTCTAELDKCSPMSNPKQAIEGDPIFLTSSLYHANV